jgi:hypothetical protein
MKTFRQHQNDATPAEMPAAVGFDIAGRDATIIGCELPLLQPQLPALPAP